jgi:hypothetical protein
MKMGNFYKADLRMKCDLLAVTKTFAYLSKPPLLIRRYLFAVALYKLLCSL